MQINEYLQSKQNYINKYDPVLPKYSNPEYFDDLDEFQSIKVLSLSRQLFKTVPLEYFFRHKLADVSNFKTWLKSQRTVDEYYKYLKTDAIEDIGSDRRSIDENPANNYLNNPDTQPFCLESRLEKLKSIYELYQKQTLIAESV